MSSNNEEHKIRMVRILPLDKSDEKIYRNKVTISILFDNQRPLKYLRIKSEEKTVFQQEFSGLQWLHESSTSGVTTIRTTKTTLVIIYDAKNELLIEFFRNLQKSLTQESKTATTVDTTPLQSNQDQLASMIDHLVKSINSGESNETERITQELAKSQANVQFNLINKNNNQEKNMTKSQPNSDIARSSDTVLQLLLRVECPLMKDSITASINVRFGTTLQSLKEQIEKETNIKCTDQYWFAFDRYPIPNEYIFGSSVSIISNQSQQRSLMNSIRSGDTIIMYITQMSSTH